MRDRLIELFKKMDKNPEITCPKPDDVEACETCKYKITELLCDGLARKVDYLLANGVIAPPVKIGQTVYVVSRYYGGFWRTHECRIDSLTIYEKHMFMTLFDRDNYDFGIEISEIGKTVFLTKEQAEKALAERSTDEK